MLAGAATEVPCGVGVCSARAVAGVRVCMPVSQDIEQGFRTGLTLETGVTGALNIARRT